MSISTVKFAMKENRSTPTTPEATREMKPRPTVQPTSQKAAYVARSACVFCVRACCGLIRIRGRILRVSQSRTRVVPLESLPPLHDT